MPGRHVYRVLPQETGGWSVRKEGEATARASRNRRDEAAQLACELAMADEPSKVIVEEADGRIVEERLFGAEDAEPRAEGSRSPP